VFTVNNAGDTGPGAGLAGDLRYCLTQANATPGLNTIQFAIAGAGLHTINLTAVLPTITNAVALDGYTQAGASANTLAVGDNAVLTIELDGAAAGSDDSGLTINAGGCTIRGLVIGGFGRNGILDLSAGGTGGNVIEGNFIGTDATGTVAMSNGAYGVRIEGATGDTIGGATPDARNVISGSGNSGIRISGTANIVQGNYVGTDASGLVALGNVGNINDGAITVFSGGNTITGNVVSGNTGVGILIWNAGLVGNVIENNYVGLGADGTSAVNNVDYGIYLALGSTNTLVQGNVIGDDGGFGILLDAGAANATLCGNFIGTDKTGSLGRPITNGIYTQAPNTLILVNVVSDCGFPASGGGIHVAFSSATGAVIQGNMVGLNAAGTAALGNGTGIDIQDAVGATIGGLTAGAGNVIAGNGEFGIVLDQGSTGTLVEGNKIGSNAAGTVAFPNGTQSGGVGGIEISDSPNNTIGGTVAAARNLISGNQTDGIDLFRSGSTGNVVEGNFIGTDATGSAPLGNHGDGVRVEDGATNNLIGGDAAMMSNTIAFNGGAGVAIIGNTTTGNTIQDNSIFGNAHLGIDLGGTDTVLANDSHGHSGPNNFEDFPVLTPVRTSGTSRTAFGSLDSTPNTSFRIEFFANCANDPSGFGQGQVYLGFMNATTDATGHASFDFSWTADPAHLFVTSTATDPGGNTSEFSAVVTDAPPSPPVTVANPILSQEQAVALVLNANAASPTPVSAPASTTGAPAGDPVSVTGSLIG
jgi:titin